VRRVFNVCIEEQRLDGANPFARPGRVIGGIRRRQSSEVARVRTFTAAELAALLETARLPRFAWLYPILVFLVSTGARRGEALGLRWADVDLVRGVVAIRRARVRGRYVVPKSGREREIPLDAASPLLREVLLEAIVRGESPAPDALVFTSPRGCILQERNVHRGWYRLRRAAGVSPLRMHDLRHTFASRAIGAGVSIPRVSAWLGHAQIATTLAVYTHVLPPNREPSGFLALATTKGTDSQ
jgi:integrase